MRVLITGAAGFIGSYIIPELERTKNEVIAFDIAPKPKFIADIGEAVTYIRGDLANTADLYRAVVSTQPTHILHLGSILAGPCEENPAKGFGINFNSTLTLLDAAVQVGVKRFVMTSSISVFGRGLEEPVKDEAEKYPETIYGQTKLAAEHLLRWYNVKGLVSTGAVRFPWVFGPGRSTGITALWSSKLLDEVAAGNSLTIENPDETGNWLYVKDAVKALLLLLKIPKHNKIAYNIMGSGHSIKEVMEIVQKIEPDSNITYVPRNTSASPYPSSFDDQNARNELKWRPDFTIEDAVKDHIKLYRERNS